MDTIPIGTNILVYLMHFTKAINIDWVGGAEVSVRECWSGGRGFDSHVCIFCKCKYINLHK